MEYNLNNWLKVEIDHITPNSDIKQINNAIEDLKRILEKLLNEEIDVEGACNQIKEIAFKLVGLLTGHEEPEPDPGAVLVESEQDAEEWCSDLNEDLVRDEIIDELRRTYHIHEVLTRFCEN